MDTMAVNGIPAVISDLFSKCSADDPYIVLCLKQAGSNFTILAHKGPGAWQVITPFQASTQELFAAIDAAQFVMAGHPQVKQGYTYMLFCRFTCELSPSDRVRLIAETSNNHDRVFTIATAQGLGVVPQAAAVLLMRGIPDNVHQVSIFYTINFSARKYTLTGLRYLGDMPIEIGTELDPLGFEMALRALKWRMIAPPNYNSQNNYTAYAKGTNNNYTATIERSTEGERFMLDSETDRQNSKARRAGMDAHFAQSISHRNTASR